MLANQFFFFFIFHLFWLHWVFVAVSRLSLAAASRGFSLLAEHELLSAVAPLVAENRL